MNIAKITTTDGATIIIKDCQILISTIWLEKSKVTYEMKLTGYAYQIPASKIKRKLYNLCLSILQCLAEGLQGGEL